MCQGFMIGFGTESFDELYIKYENDESIPKKKLNAQELILDLLKERAETGSCLLYTSPSPRDH